jgi:hypothetical protein
MFGQTFAHNTIRKYVVLFGTLFDNIYINRENSSGETIQTLKVPLSYGPKEKFLSRVSSDGTLSQPVAVVLPRMSFEMTSMTYAADRKLNTMNKIHKVYDSGQMAYQYSPVPYDFTFQLAIMVKNAEDGTKIIEQILPYFTPEWTASVNLSPDVNGKYDVPIIFNNITSDDTYEGDYTTRRALIHTLDFTVKGYLFGPTRRSDIIKEINVDIRVPDSNTIPLVANTLVSNSAVITITPGQYANGDAASWTGSATANTRPTVVNADEVTANENYGFLIDFTENT